MWVERTFDAVLVRCDHMCRIFRPLAVLVGAIGCVGIYALMTYDLDRNTGSNTLLARCLA
jgi:hypothetical protein